jgi:hypothetical protein
MSVEKWTMPNNDQVALVVFERKVQMTLGKQIYALIDSE